MDMLMILFTKKSWIFQNAVACKMICHHRAWRHAASWLKINYLHRWWDTSVGSPCCWAPTAPFCPQKKGSHIQHSQKEGHPLWGAESNWRLQCGLWIQVCKRLALNFPPPLPILLWNLCQQKKRLYLQKAPILAAQNHHTSDFYGKSSIGQCYIKRHLDSYLKE